MKKYKVDIITLLVALAVLIKELNIYQKAANKADFSYFIREYFNKIFIEMGNRQIIDVTRFFLVVGFYFIIYYLFYNAISVNIENFKRLIKYNSRNIIAYYFNVVKFFGKIFLKSAILNIIIFVVCYKIFFSDNNYYQGVVDLVKLPLTLFLILIISAVFSLKRVVVSTMFYIGIVMYVLFLHKISVIYIACAYIVVLVYIAVHTFIKENDI